MSFTCRICGNDTDQNFGADRFFPLCQHCFAAEYFTCSECQETIHNENRYIEAGSPTLDLCISCHAEHYTRCAECGISHRRAEMIQTDEGVFCHSCYDSQYVVCHECDQRIRRSRTVETHDGHLICDSCHAHYYFQCQDCQQVFHSSLARHHYGVCPNCYSANYRTCDWCHNAWIPIADLTNENAGRYVTHFDGEQAFCETCSNSFRQEGITNYSYKPFALLHGDRNSRHYGIELEVDDGGHNREHANTIKGIANQDALNIYIKSDGSINDGFEIVTHPMTYEYLMECVPWAEMFNKLLELGYRSHKSRTCGLHIHVEREHLGADLDEREAVISRILFFVEKHWDQILDFSRRTKRQVGEWARRYGVKNCPAELLDLVKEPNGTLNPHSRYACVNLLPDQTIEFRIFRGTLKLNTFLATIQLVDEICETALRLTSEEMVDLSWKNFVMGIDPEQKPELIAYLKERQLYVNELVLVAVGGGVDLDADDNEEDVA